MSSPATPEGSGRPWVSSLGFVLVVFLVSRLTLQVVGVLAHKVLGPFVSEHYVWRYHDKLWLDIWGVLDTGWYLSIVEHGYQALPQTQAAGEIARSNHAFFPAYPLLVRAVAAAVGHPLLAGVLVSNLCFLGALILLHGLVRERVSAPIASSVVLIAAFFPGSYVYSSMYTESLFLLLLLGCFHYALRGRWLMVGLLGAALTATRLVGIVVALPMAMIYLERHGLQSLRTLRTWLRLSSLSLFALGLVIYMVLLYQVVGDPWYFLEVQAGWGRVFQNPLTVLLTPLWHPTYYNIFQALFGIASLAALLPLVRRRLFPELVLALLFIGIPLSSGIPYAPLASLARYILVVYPVFIGLALLVKDRPEARAVMLAGMATLNGFLMVCWATGMFFVM